MTIRKSLRRLPFHHVGSSVCLLAICGALTLGTASQAQEYSSTSSSKESVDTGPVRLNSSNRTSNRTEEDERLRNRNGKDRRQTDSNRDDNLDKSELERIRRFELDGPIQVRSPVQEVDRLAEALGNMKAGLASFGTYVPKSLVEDIIRSGAGTGIGGERRPLTVMFTDLAGFTAASESMEPEQVLPWLSDYFDAMSRAIHSHGGTIDKFIGDAILIFYGDPTSRGAKEDALACVSMAIEMRREMQILRQKWQSMGIERPLHIRMGVTTGYCHVGNFGSESRMSYTIIGRDANLAARLQSVASPDEILISHETYMMIRDKIMCREKGAVTLRGIAKPIQVWEVVEFHADMQSNSTWIEHELNGFAMHMDINKVRNYDKERILKALELAAQQLKDTRIL